jgi:hypothetical protein
MPRVHPIIQLMGAEWASAEKLVHDPDWSIFTTAYISSYCETLRSDHPGWHPDLYASDLSGYLLGQSKRKLWWLPGAQAGQTAIQARSDGAPAISDVMCIV